MRPAKDDDNISTLREILFGNKITEFTPDGQMNTFFSDVRQPFSLAFEGVTLPVPEPSVLCLVAAGLTGIIGRCCPLFSKKSL